MALTIEATTPQSGDVWGRQKVRIVNATFDASYDEGGESFVPADVGLAEFTFVSVSVDAATSPGLVAQYDYTAQAILVFGVEQDADGSTTEHLDEEDDTEDLDGLVIRVLCVGH
jgi:hypothetical protein